MQLMVQALPRTPCTRQGEGKQGSRGTDRADSAPVAHTLYARWWQLGDGREPLGLAVARGRGVEEDTVALAR
jgi:hypothetical protein